MGEEIWKAEWPRQIIGVAIMGALVAIIEHLNPQFGPEMGWAPFVLPSVFSFALPSVSGILFGAWGVIAVYLGLLPTLIYFYRYSPLEIPLLISVIFVFQSIIPAWAFRHFKADPRLKTARDGKVFVVFGIIASSFAGSLEWPIVWGLYVHYFHASWPLHLDLIVYVWLILSLIHTFISTPLLWLFSRIVIKTRAYCEGWFS